MTSLNTVLITGGGGFIGRVACARLIKRGATVVLVDNSLDEIGDLASRPGVKVLKGDVSDYGQLENLIRDVAPDSVIHLAAIIGDTADSEPVKSTLINCMGTANLLQACAAANVARVVLMSTISVYGSANKHRPSDLPLREGAAPFLNTSQLLYSAGKLYNEALGTVYADKHGLSTAWLRPSFVCGPGRTRGATLFNEIVEGPIHGRAVKVPYAGTAAFTYIFIEDVAMQLETLASADEAQLRPQRCFNTGGQLTTFDEMADAVRGLVPGADITFDPMGSTEIRGVTGNTSGQSFINTFGVGPAYSMNQGVAAHVAEIKAALA